MVVTIFLPKLAEILNADTDRDPIFTGLGQRKVETERPEGGKFVNHDMAGCAAFSVDSF
ncbi:MAG TPA: hypothetical protein VGM41_20880 [Chitinophagaceae bacterium]